MVGVERNRQCAFIRSNKPDPTLPPSDSHSTDEMNHFVQDLSWSRNVHDHSNMLSPIRMMLTSRDIGNGYHFIALDSPVFGG
jgi:hypothetical protein